MSVRTKFGTNLEVGKNNIDTRGTKSNQTQDNDTRAAMIEEWLKLKSPGSGTTKDDDDIQEFKDMMHAMNAKNI